MVFPLVKSVQDSFSIQLAMIGFPAGVLAARRRLRLSMNGYWKINLVKATGKVLILSLLRDKRKSFN